MKAEKTSKLIEEMAHYVGSDMWPKRFREMAEESDEELNELLRLAEIGKMIQWAIDEEIQFIEVPTSAVEYETYINESEMEQLGVLYREQMNRNGEYLDGECELYQRLKDGEPNE